MGLAILAAGMYIPGKIAKWIHAIQVQQAKAVSEQRFPQFLVSFDETQNSGLFIPVSLEIIQTDARVQYVTESK